MSICKHCKIIFDTLSEPKGWMANHVRWCAENPNKPVNKEKIRRAENKGRKRAISDEGRRNIAAGRRKFLKENPDAHPWKKADKFVSKPCEKLKELLRAKEISFIEEWTPLQSRNFSIDIAFPDIKLGIEVNGNQHYNRDGTLRQYYKERHDLICESGWTLIELYYTDCFNLDKICDIIKHREQPDYSEYFKIKEEKRTQKTKGLKAGQKVRNKADLKWEPFKEKVLNSSINFSKYGWAQKASDILQIAPQNVSRWMKRHLPEFYETKCFKRK